MVRRLRTIPWRADDESGQALVEAALAIPVLLVVVFGVVAAGRVTEAKIAVQSPAERSRWRRQKSRASPMR